MPSPRHFEIHVGRCTACGRTVHGRHRLQTSDGKEVGTVQLGPQLIATAAHINKVDGLSYGRVSGLLERLFGVTVSRSGLARSMGRQAERGEPKLRYAVINRKTCGAGTGRVTGRGRSPS